MTSLSPEQIAAMNAKINDPGAYGTATGMQALGIMGDRFSALPTDPLFMTSLGLLTNDGRLSPGMAQNAVLMQQMRDRKQLTEEERKRLEEKERKARDAQLAYAKGLLQATGGAPANSGTGLLGQQVDQETLQRAAAMVLDPSAGVRRMMPHLLGGYMFPNGGPPGGGGAPPPPAGPSAQQQIQGLLRPADQAMMQGPLPFDRAPAGEGQPFGADLVGPDAAKQRLLAANLAMMQNGTVEQAAEAQSAITKMLNEDARVIKSDIDQRHYWIDGPLAGQPVLPNVKPPDTPKKLEVWTGADKSDLGRTAQVQFDRLMLDNPGRTFTQEDATRYGAGFAQRYRDLPKTVITPTGTQEIPGMGVKAFNASFLRTVGGPASAPKDVQQKIKDRGGLASDPTISEFLPPTPTTGGYTSKPLTAGDSKTLTAGSYLADVNTDLLDSMERFNVASMWNAPAAMTSGITQNVLASPEYQVFSSNAKIWADEVLRYKTGAQANESEVRNVADMFMPQPGESVMATENKNMQRIRWAIRQIEAGITRSSEAKEHESVTAGRALLQRLKTYDFPYARLNYDRAVAGEKPLTRDEYNALLEAKKAQVREAKKARAAAPKPKPAAPKREPYQMTAPIFQRMRMEQEAARKKSLGDLMGEFGE